MRVLLARYFYLVFVVVVVLFSVLLFILHTVDISQGHTNPRKVRLSHSSSPILFVLFYVVEMVCH